MINPEEVSNHRPYDYPESISYDDLKKMSLDDLHELQHMIEAEKIVVEEKIVNLERETRNYQNLLSEKKRLSTRIYDALFWRVHQDVDFIADRTAEQLPTQYNNAEVEHKSTITVPPESLYNKFDTVKPDDTFAGDTPTTTDTTE